MSAWDDPPPAEPDPEVVERSTTVEVERTTVEQLGTGVRWLIAMTVAFGVFIAWDGCQDQRTDERQDVTNERLDKALDDLAAQNARLDEVIAQRAEDASRASATECVRSHVRFDLLQRILEALGADEETLSILPPPACDLGEAQAELTEG